MDDATPRPSQWNSMDSNILEMFECTGLEDDFERIGHQLTKQFRKKQHFRWTKDHGFQFGFPQSGAVVWCGIKSEAEMRERLFPNPVKTVKGKTMERQPKGPAEWSFPQWFAQLVHYGLPLTISRCDAKATLKKTLEQGTLKIPDSLHMMDLRLKRRELEGSGTRARRQREADSHRTEQTDDISDDADTPSSTPEETQSGAHGASSSNNRMEHYAADAVLQTAQQAIQPMTTNDAGFSLVLALRQPPIQFVDLTVTEPVLQNMESSSSNSTAAASTQAASSNNTAQANTASGNIDGDAMEIEIASGATSLQITKEARPGNSSGQMANANERRNSVAPAAGGSQDVAAEGRRRRRWLRNQRKKRERLEQRRIAQQANGVGNGQNPASGVQGMAF